MFDYETNVVQESILLADDGPFIRFAEPLPAPLQVAGNGRLSHEGRRQAESNDGYPAVVAVLNSRWRIIVCKDGIQWILQFLTGKNGNRWRGQSFCRTKAGLMLAIRMKVQGDIASTAMAMLDALPDRIEGRDSL